jgi:hypothetical protein
VKELLKINIELDELTDKYEKIILNDKIEKRKNRHKKKSTTDIHGSGIFILVQKNQ